MNIPRVDILTPLWLGGKRRVGIAQYKLQQAPVIEVTILYRNRDGERVYPHLYRIISVPALAKAAQEKMTKPRKGLMICWIPIEDLEVIGPTIDPALMSRPYLDAVKAMREGIG